MATSRVTEPTGLKPGNERWHRHEGDDHRSWVIVKPGVVGPSGKTLFGATSSDSSSRWWKMK